MSAQGVPQAVCAEVEHLLARAAAAGRIFAPVPGLVLDAAREPAVHVTHPPRGTPGVSLVHLTPEVLARAPRERAWTLAHELAHVLRHQDGTYARDRRFLDVAWCAAALTCLAGLLTGAYSDLYGEQALVVLSVLVSAASALISVLVSFARVRRDEIATDTLAAVVFGHRPSQQEVVDLRRNEGRFAALVPAFLRTHPRPHRRGAARLRQHRTSS